jgi:hypothetical protein
MESKLRLEEEVASVSRSCAAVAREVSQLEVELQEREARVATLTAAFERQRAMRSRSRRAVVGEEGCAASHETRRLEAFGKLCVAHMRLFDVLARVAQSSTLRMTERDR